MKYYVAPLEGITGYSFRNIHQKHFPGADKYYIPFIEPKPNAKKVWRGREWNDLRPDHNIDICAIPQVLTNKWEDFAWSVEKLGELGYTEVNLNLGCPSRTVVSKNRGSGFLAFPEELDAFLYYIFRDCKADISIKTRLGRDETGEFEKLLKIYEKYPIKELIIHPRTQKDYYNQKLHLEQFGTVLKGSPLDIGFNGEIVTCADFKAIQERFPDLKTVMMGRGILCNPQLIENLQKGTLPERKRIKAFHDDLLEEYRREIGQDKQALFKMKELWCYLGQLFLDQNSYRKKILKVKHMEEFIVLKEQIFAECEMRPQDVCSSGIWTF